jgi:hypothetical protein
MRTLSRSGLAAAVILALSGMTDVAYGGVEKFFITGNSTTCSAVFSALQAQHPADFPPGSFGSGVNAQIVVSPLGDGTYSEASPFGADGIHQDVQISGVTADGNIFDWREILLPGGAPQKRGFDVVAIKAGNGRTVYVYEPDSTGDDHLSDLNTTQNITLVLLCADSNVTIVSGGPLCNLDSTQLGTVCGSLGKVVVEVSTPGNSETQICACPGITFNVCNPKLVCVPSPTNDCMAQFPGGFCDPAHPDDLSTANVTETACCLRSAISGAPLTLTSTPVGTSSVTGVGSCCTAGRTTSGGGGTSSIQSCFSVSFPPDPPCP